MLTPDDGVAFCCELAHSDLLVRMGPQFEGDERKREVFLTPELASHMAMEDDQTPPWSILRAVIDNFLVGDLIRYKVGGKNEPSAEMCHLNPLSDGVWTMRASEPKPGIRIFGLFAAKDCFVGFNWADRIVLESFNSSAWRREIRTAKTKWTNLFATRQALHGEKSNDYATGLFLMGNK